jgi:hypothetical protein
MNILVSNCSLGTVLLRSVHECIYKQLVNLVFGMYITN